MAQQYVNHTRIGYQQSGLSTVADQMNFSPPIPDTYHLIPAILIPDR
jgi:hypothetical protein